jgi:putative flippase GtrA
MHDLGVRTLRRSLSVRPLTSSWRSQARRFAASGVVNTLTDYVVFMALTKIFSIPLDRVWTAKLVSGGLAMSVSFLLNRRWVFATHEAGRAGQAVRFVIATISASWGIQLGLTQLFSSVWPAPGVVSFAVLRTLGVPSRAPGVLTEAAAIKTAAFALATCASMVWNFVLYRTWVFRESLEGRRTTRRA